MKSVIIVALALVAVAVAAPVEKDPITNISSDFQRKEGGGYVFGFENNDGTKRQENGELKDSLDEDNKPIQVVSIRGSYSYISPNGAEETVNYYADETGYHAEGPSIPVAV